MIIALTIALCMTRGLNISNDALLHIIEFVDQASRGDCDAFRCTNQRFNTLFLQIYSKPLHTRYGMIKAVVRSWTQYITAIQTEDEDHESQSQTAYIEMFEAMRQGDKDRNLSRTETQVQIMKCFCSRAIINIHQDLSACKFYALRWPALFRNLFMRIDQLGHFWSKYLAWCLGLFDFGPPGTPYGEHSSQPELNFEYAFTVDFHEFHESDYFDEPVLLKALVVMSRVVAARLVWNFTAFDEAEQAT